MGINFNRTTMMFTSSSHSSSHGSSHGSTHSSSHGSSHSSAHGSTHNSSHNSTPGSAHNSSNKTSKNSSQKASQSKNKSSQAETHKTAAKNSQKQTKPEKIYKDSNSKNTYQGTSTNDGYNFWDHFFYNNQIHRRSIYIAPDEPPKNLTKIEETTEEAIEEVEKEEDKLIHK